MKYIIGAILGMMLGAGIEYERGSHEIKLTLYPQLGLSYGCGRNAGMKYAIETIKPDEKLLAELSACSDYRMMWEAVR